MNTKQLKKFADFAREQMNRLSCTKEQMKTAFVSGLMNSYAKYRGIEGVCFDDSLVPENILSKLSSDILSGEFVRVEAVGWIYQYFVDADRAEAVDVIGGADIDGSLVTAATQVFTPGWIAEYLTDNSLGKYFAAMFGEDICRENLHSYISTGETLPEPAEIGDISFFDPCCGSGNILIYAFDVYMKMYTLLGFEPAEAARRILTENIFGADIDANAVSLASFALMMKAAEYDSSIFAAGIRPNIYLLSDEDNIGSLDFSGSSSCITAGRYSVVCTNPPYLGRIGGGLKSYLNSVAKPYSKDLFTAFMYRGLMYCEDGGYMAFLTPNVWMYLSSHKAIRELILDEKCLCSLIQLEKGSFFSEASVDLCAFVVKNKYESLAGIYIRPEGAVGMAGQQKVVNEAVVAINSGEKCSYVYKVRPDSFDAFPDRVMAFYVPERVSRLFKGIKIGDVYTVKQGMTTGNNNRFVKYWYEVPYDSIGFYMSSTDEAKKSCKKWFPYNKGGKYRKWYGNNDYVVMYENDGAEMKEYTSKLPQGTWVRLKSRDYYFKESVTWSFISSSHFGVRYSPEGSIFDVAGSSLFGSELKYVLGFLSTKTAFYLLQLINPTMNYQIRDIKLLPFIADERAKAEVETLVDRCIELSRREWDSSELSYGFARDPLVEISQGSMTAEEAIDKYIFSAEKDFYELKSCESRINSIFAGIYSVEGIIDTDICDSDITFRLPDKKSCAENLMSYIAGCACGRYCAGFDGVAGTAVSYISFKELAEYADRFIKKNFSGNSAEYISFLLETDNYTYYRKKFLKKHFAMYRKRPIYTPKDDGVAYFDFNT